MRQYVYTLLVIIEIQVIWTIHKTLSQSSVPYRGLIKSNALVKICESFPSESFRPLSGINKI